MSRWREGVCLGEGCPTGGPVEGWGVVTDLGYGDGRGRVTLKIAAKERRSTYREGVTGTVGETVLTRVTLEGKREPEPSSLRVIKDLVFSILGHFSVSGPIFY